MLAQLTPLHLLVLGLALGAIWMYTAGGSTTQNT